MYLEDGKTSSALGFFVISFSFLVGMLLFLIFFDMFSSVRSPGKWLLSLKIIRSPAVSPSGGWRILRSLIKNTPLILMFSGLGLLSIPYLGALLFVIGFILAIIWVITLFVTQKSQSVHDLVAGTFVTVYHKR